jgi:hypothetical protein
MVATTAGAKIIKLKPHESDRVGTTAGTETIIPKPNESDRIAILMQSGGMLSTEEDEIIFILFFPISDNAFREICQRTSVISGELQLPTNTLELPANTLGLLVDMLELRLQSSVSERVNCTTRIPSDSMGIIYESTGFETVPQLVPYLTVRLDTGRITKG